MELQLVIALVLCGRGGMRIRLILAVLIGADRQRAGAGSGAGGSACSSDRSSRYSGAAAGALAGAGDDLELRPPQIPNVAAATATTAETGMWMDVEMEMEMQKMGCCSLLRASLGWRSS